MKFFSSALVLALCAAVVSADFATVQQDIASIDAAVIGLRDSFPANPESISYISALGIHSKALDADKIIKKSTDDVNALTEQFSEAQAQEILDTLSKTEGNVKVSVDKLVAAKPRFEKLGVASLAKSDIEALATDTKTFGAALVNKAPASKQADATALSEKFNTDLAAGVAAYAA